MKTITKVGLLLLAVFFVTMVGCGVQESDSTGLTISVGFDGSKQIVPGELGEGMFEVGKYLIEGIHQESGATFSREIVLPNTSCDITCSVGTWDVTAVAMNTSTVAVELGSGSGSGVVAIGSFPTIAITVVPYTTTTGTMVLNVIHGSYVVPDWRGDVQKPGVTEPIHTFTNADFIDVDQGDGTAIGTATLNSLANGWYFTRVELWDDYYESTILDSGFLDAILIVARPDGTGMTTVCNFLLPIAGGLTVEITPDLYHTLEVALLGVPDYYVRFSQPQITATVEVEGYTEADNEIYVVWALDGKIVQEGMSWTYLVPDTVGKGPLARSGFRIDSLCYTVSNNGMSMGSDYDSFEVIVE